MDEVRVLENSGSSQPVPRSVGPSEYKDPQEAQDAPVEQINKNSKSDDSEAAVLSPSLERVMSRASNTRVRFTPDSPQDGSKGKINFEVVDKESGEVVRSFPSEEIKKVIAATNAKLGEGVFVDTMA